MMMRLEEKDRRPIEIVSPATAAERYGYVPDYTEPLRVDALAGAVMTLEPPSPILLPPPRRRRTRYLMGRRPIPAGLEAEFLTDAEVVEREAGSMVHDQTERLVISAAEEKRLRKAAKKAENEARARAGRGA